jgi:hypothetical protein
VFVISCLVIFGAVVFVGTPLALTVLRSNPLRSTGELVTLLFVEKLAEFSLVAVVFPYLYSISVFSSDPWVVVSVVSLVIGV